MKDWDQVGKNDVIGRVVVTQDDLLNGKGERTEFKLRDTADKNRPGMLVLRFRRATKHDVLFMDRLASAQNSKITGVYGDDTLLPPKVSTDGVLSVKHVKGIVRRGHRGCTYYCTVLSPCLSTIAITLTSLPSASSFCTIEAGEQLQVRFFVYSFYLAIGVVESHERFFQSRRCA